MRIRFRLSIFDVGIFLMVLITAWVVASAYQTLRQLAAGRERFNAMQGMVRTLGELAKPFESIKLKDIFAMKDLADLREQYFSISEQVERSLGALEKSLHDFVTTKNREQLKQFHAE